MKFRNLIYDNNNIIIIIIIIIRATIIIIIIIITHFSFFLQKDERGPKRSQRLFMPHALAFNSSQSITASGTGEKLEKCEAPVRGIEFSFLHLSFF